ncbi:MAG TPA: class I SAM-dependent RNA methyltransferase [Anaerolineaceae bacterium]|jgi:23S rRNA (uracil1939-C5)-methyltransferase|nr:class I SAM-dependent RNA methyltransferase [Anaerolineaceae bacterium]
MMIDLELQTLTFGGDALGRLPDGRAVFVPFGLPGERVRVELVEEKPRHARGRLMEVLRPSPDRIVPRCPHFGFCGGCHYQHLSYDRQVQVKAGILREQLVRIGGIDSPPVAPMMVAPQPWNYRNSIRFHLDDTGRLGFEPAGGRGVIPITECHLPEPPLNEVWPQLNFEPLPGIERVGLRLGVNDEILMALESSEFVAAPELELDLPISVVHLSPEGPLVLAGDPGLWMSVKETLFQVSAGAFFQVNTAQAAAMVDHLLGRLPLTPASTILDVYCGVGLFSRFLAPQVGQVIGVELSAAACDDYIINLDAFDHVSLYVGAAEEVLPGLDVEPDAVIVDPPRSGLDRTVLDALIRLGPPVLAYVSCDPATLARDARRLMSAGYELQLVTPFDLFPQTYHIESVSWFTRSTD